MLIEEQWFSPHKISICFSFWLYKLKLLWEVILFITPTSRKFHIHDCKQHLVWSCHAIIPIYQVTVLVWNASISILPCLSSLTLTKFHFWQHIMRFLQVELIHFIPTWTPLPITIRCDLLLGKVEKSQMTLVPMGSDLFNILFPCCLATYLFCLLWIVTAVSILEKILQF